MEIPIPNFYFMGVQFVHLLALSIWVGGIVIIQVLVAPILFQENKSSQMAGLLLNKIFVKFDKITLFCSGALILTGIIKFLQWENLTPWNTVRYLAISTMSSVSLYTAINISPKMGRDVSSSSSETSMVTSANRHHLHQVSERLMQINLICGVTALLMA